MRDTLIRTASACLAALALIGLATGLPSSSTVEPPPETYRSNAPDDEAPLPEEVLRAAGFELTVEALSAAVRDPEVSPEVRYWAALALGRGGDSRALSALVDVLDSPHLDVRYGAVVGLGELGSRRSVRVLAPRLADSDSRVRSVAVQAIARIGGHQAVSLLAEKLQDAGEPEAGIRMNAAFELGRSGSLAAIPALEAALGDGSAEVRTVAAVALAGHQRPEAVPTLVEVSLSPLTEEWLRLDAVQALEKLSRQTFGYAKGSGTTATGPERTAALQLIESWWQSHRHEYPSR